MARTGGEPGAPAAGPPAPPAGVGEPGEPAGWPRASPRRNLKARAHQAASYMPFPTWLTRRDDEGGTARAGRGDLEHLQGGRRGGGRRSLVPPSSSGSSTPLITRIGRARGTHNDKMNALSASRSASRDAGVEGGAGERGQPFVSPLSQPTGEGAMITNGRAHGNAN